MKLGYGKTKGNRFENLFGRKLSLWLTGGKDSTQLISTRLSGGWKDARWRQAGDLAPNGPAGERFRKLFMVECKHHKKDLLWTMFGTAKESIPEWWHKLWKEAVQLNLIPMLVCRQNNRPILIGLPIGLARIVADGESVLGYHDDSLDAEFGLILWETLATRWTPKQLYKVAQHC